MTTTTVAPTTTQTSRTWTLRVEGAEPTTGVTTGLREATVIPERIELTEFGSDTVRAILTGPRVLASGHTGSQATVKVLVSRLDGGVRAQYPDAPAWVREVYRRVS